MVNDGDVVCQIAIDFQAHIESLKTIADEYVRMLALFVSMNRVGTIGLHLFGRCSVNISTSSVTCIRARYLSKFESITIDGVSLQ